MKGQQRHQARSTAGLRSGSRRGRGVPQGEPRAQNTGIDDPVSKGQSLARNNPPSFFLKHGSGSTISMPGFEYASGEPF